MCSSVFGPAMPPPLVTCPTTKTAVPRLLGEAHQPRRALAHLPHVARRAFEVPGECTVWIESTTITAGAQVGGRGEDRLEVRLAEQRHGTPVAPSGRRAASPAAAILRRSRTACDGRRLKARGHLQQDRALADARLAAHEHHRCPAPRRRRARSRTRRCPSPGDVLPRRPRRAGAASRHSRRLRRRPWRRRGVRPAPLDAALTLGAATPRRAYSTRRRHRSVPAT
jgi:hypothetical protein